MYSLIIDFNLVCAVCLADSPSLQSIYTADNQTQMTVAEKIAICSELQLQMPHDKLPDKICPSCIDDLEAVLRFRENCKTANEVFHSLLHQDQYAVMGPITNLGMEQQQQQQQQEETSIKVPAGLKIKRIGSETEAYLMPMNVAFVESPPSGTNEIPNSTNVLKEEKGNNENMNDDDDDDDIIDTGDREKGNLNELVVLVESDDEKHANEDIETLDDDVDNDNADADADDDANQTDTIMDVMEECIETDEENSTKFYEATSEPDDGLVETISMSEEGKENSSEPPLPVIISQKKKRSTTSTLTAQRKRANTSVIKHIPRQKQQQQRGSGGKRSVSIASAPKKKRARMDAYFEFIRSSDTDDDDDNDSLAEQDTDTIACDINADGKNDGDEDEELATIDDDEVESASVAKPRNRTRTTVRQRPIRRPQKICDICGNTYKYQHALNAHMRRHTNTKPFPCEFCDRAFVSNVELRRHMRVHTGQKPYACQYCDRRFSDYGSRIKHERSHTGERPYVCTCGKTFAYAHVLTVHMRTHTGEKKFKCALCPKGFTKKAYLETHMEQHSRSSSSVAMVNMKEENQNSLDIDNGLKENLNGVDSMAIKTVALEECIFTTEFVDDVDDLKPIQPIIDDDEYILGNCTSVESMT